jgi:hypothetical protein
VYNDYLELKYEEFEKFKKIFPKNITINACEFITVKKLNRAIKSMNAPISLVDHIKVIIDDDDDMKILLIQSNIRKISITFEKDC